MSNYIIVKTEKINALGTLVETQFIIKRKILWFFYINHSTMEAVKNIFHECRLVYDYQRIFNNLEDAKEYLENIKKPFEIYYKNQRIVKYYMDSLDKWIYVNMSDARPNNDVTYYDYDEDLANLKLNIDKKLITSITTIIK